MKEEGQQVVWWGLYKHEKNETGHKMNKWLISKRGASREALPVSTEPGSMIGFTPLTIQFRILVEEGGCANP